MNNDEKQKPGITLSPSALDTLHQCPKKYYFRYIQKIRIKEETPALLYGEMIHSIIERYDHTNEQSLKDLFKFYQSDEKMRETFWLKILETYKENIPIIIKNIRNYFLYNHRDTKILSKEKVFNIYNFDKIEQHNEVADIHLQGKVDLMFYKDDIFYISDFKTSKKKGNYEKQLQFYYYLISKFEEYKKYKNFCGQIIYLTLDNQLCIDTINLKEENILEIDAYIKESIENIRKRGITLDSGSQWEVKPSFKCKTCPYYKVYCNPYLKK